jgi:hypothetical protein
MWWGRIVLLVMKSEKKSQFVFLIVVPFSGFASTKIRNKNVILLLDLYQVGLFI